MRLTILGSGSSKGISRVGHRDALCVDARKKGSKSRRRRSSALVEQAGRRILIDVSPDFLSQMKRARVSRLDAVLLTHAHADATGGLSDLGKWIRLRRHDPVTLYAHPDTIRRLRRSFPKSIIPIPVRPFRMITIAGMNIRFIPVRHGMRGIATYGFRFGRRLFFASDMDATSPAGIKIIHGTPTIILDGAFWEDKRLRGHFSVPDTLEFAKTIRPRRLIITQSGHSFPPHNLAEAEIRRLAKQKSCPFPVKLAYDGMKIEI